MDGKIVRRVAFLVLLILLFIFYKGNTDYNLEKVMKPSEFFPNVHWRYKPRPKNYNPAPYQYFGTEPIEDSDLLGGGKSSQCSAFSHQQQQILNIGYRGWDMVGVGLASTRIKSEILISKSETD